MNKFIYKYCALTPMIPRNPFAPKNGILWSNTYEMWKQRGIIQPEVDPWE